MMQCDKHVNKMCLESAQMLSTAHRILDGKPKKQLSKSGKSLVTHYELDVVRENTLYRVAHANHPCSKWVRETSGNYNWMFYHWKHLCKEFYFRFGKKHKSTELAIDLAYQPININLDNKTPFVLAMNNYPEYMFKDDPVKSYRMFYQTKQDRFAMKWEKGREKPEWFKLR